ncbi:hypothetical protein NQ318_002150 [Aromia moschata]|uniref:CCHC-type domain-containing protein n=1 Tax=Aromia moschata TaxID=1265417 RepID=A0AAV8XKX9_9CUCU|nr:hypothetical protein NQ318_002150 [Aromia moschata]
MRLRIHAALPSNGLVSEIFSVGSADTTDIHIHKFNTNRSTRAAEEKDTINRIQKLKLCTNCFRSNHTKQDCLSSGCKKCNQKHNTMLHFDKNNSNDSNINANNSEGTSRTSNVKESKPNTNTQTNNENSTVTMCSAN